MDRRIIKTRAAISRAYFEMLAEGSEKRITVSEISRRANIDRKTFYLHYAAVEDIPKEYLDKFSIELMNELNTRRFFEHPLRVQVVVDTFNDLIARNAENLRLMSNLECGSYFWATVHPVFVQSLVALYKDIVRISEDELRIYCTFIVSGFIRIYLDKLREGGALNLADVSRIAIDITKHGGSSIISPEALNTEFGD